MARPSVFGGKGGGEERRLSRHSRQQFVMTYVIFKPSQKQFPSKIIVREPWAPREGC